MRSLSGALLNLSIINLNHPLSLRKYCTTDFCQEQVIKNLIKHLFDVVLYTFFVISYGLYNFSLLRQEGIKTFLLLLLLFLVLLISIIENSDKRFLWNKVLTQTLSSGFFPLWISRL